WNDVRASVEIARVLKAGTTGDNKAPARALGKAHAVRCTQGAANICADQVFGKAGVTSSVGCQSGEAEVAAADSADDQSAVCGPEQVERLVFSGNLNRAPSSAPKGLIEVPVWQISR